MEKNTYRPHEFAELLGASVSTLRRWDRENILTDTGRRQTCVVRKMIREDEDIVKML